MCKLIWIQLKLRILLLKERFVSIEFTHAYLINIVRDKANDFIE